MLTIQDLQNRQWQKLSSARAFYRVVKSDTFTEAYAKASNEDREKAEKLIKTSDKQGLLHWIKAQLLDDIGTWSIRQLREQAQRLGITYSSRKDKSTLLSEIATNEQTRCQTTIDKSTCGPPYGNAGVEP